MGLTICPLFTADQADQVALSTEVRVWNVTLVPLGVCPDPLTVPQLTLAPASLTHER